jgi:hypothetical protein
MTAPKMKRQKVRRETYVEVTHSMVMALAMHDLNMAQIAMLLHQCADAKATEETLDITKEVRAELDDWSEESKGHIVGIEVVHIRMPCHNGHPNEDGTPGPCKKGFHTLQMTRVIGGPDWDPATVGSRHRFEDVVVRVSTAMHPEHGKDPLILGRGHRAVGEQGLKEAFNRTFGEQAEQIDKVVEDFRAELDALFPSVNPQQGKEEGP